MYCTLGKRRMSLWYRMLCLLLSVAFFGATLQKPVFAEKTPSLKLPAPGAMVLQSPAFVPALLRGMTVDSDNPLKFDFIVDSGQSGLSRQPLQEEAERLIRYFLAAMTIPEDDLWVNLSPHESNRIIPEELSKTELGRDLLAQDYLLKQLSASLISPQEDLGAAFWEKVYAKANEIYGTVEIPINTFNKVWIVPDSTTVYEHGQTVYIEEARLKVMLESDYMAQGMSERGLGQESAARSASSEPAQDNISKEFIREIVIPAIEEEVNTGRNFAPLRQIYHSLILAQWYKETVKDGLLSQVYVDRSKVSGIDTIDETLKENIYAQYMQAYKQGVFNFIKEEYDRFSNEGIPRKYFAGGFYGRKPRKEQKKGPGFGGRLKNLMGIGIVVSVLLGSSTGMLSPRPAGAQERQKQSYLEWLLENMGNNVILAAGQGDLAKVKRLIEQEGVDVNMQDPDGATALMSAVREGHYEVVKYLLDKGAKVDAQKLPEGLTPLIIAAMTEQSEMVRLLLARGANVNLLSPAGTALSLATFQGYSEIVNILLANGATPDVQDEQGNTPLIIAVSKNEANIVRSLLQRDANTDLQDNRRRTALDYALHHGYSDVARLLRQAGAKTNRYQYIPLMETLSATDGLNKARELIAAGADVNAKDIMGTTVLMNASNFDKPEFVKLLLASGADVNAQDDHGKSALSIACIMNHVDIVKLLIEGGADVNLKDNDAMSPLMHAAGYNYLGLARLLIDNGAQVDASGYMQSTALMFAASKGYDTMVDLLLDRGADINYISPDGVYALGMAAVSDHVGTARLLLQRGADVNGRGKGGWTALMAAAENNSDAMTRLLLQQKGIDLNIRNDQGMTALDIARRRVSRSVIKLLENAARGEYPGAERVTPAEQDAFNQHIRTVTGYESSEKIKGAIALGDLGDKRGVRYLLPLLNDSKYEVRKAAIQALQKLGEGNNPQVQEARRRILEDYLIVELSSKDADKREAAVKELDDYGLSDKQLLAIYLRALTFNTSISRRDTGASWANEFIVKKLGAFKADWAVPILWGSYQKGSDGLQHWLAIVLRQNYQAQITDLLLSQINANFYDENFLGKSAQQIELLARVNPQEHTKLSRRIFQEKKLPYIKKWGVPAGGLIALLIAMGLIKRKVSARSMGRWLDEGAEVDEEAMVLIIKNAERLKKEGETEVEEEYRGRGKADIRLNFRALTAEEMDVYEAFITELNGAYAQNSDYGQIVLDDIKFWIIKRDQSSIFHRYTGRGMVDRQGQKHVFLRDDILHPERYLQGNDLDWWNGLSEQQQRDRKKEALHHEVLHAMHPEWEHDDIRYNRQFQAGYTELSKRLIQNDKGGIDLNSIGLYRRGTGVEINFQPALVEPFLQEDIPGFIPSIINVTPINSVLPLLGLEPPELEQGEKPEELVRK